MAVDTATHISGLNTALPAGGDNRKEADNNFRHIKTVLTTDLGTIGGPIVATHTELSYVSGVTSPIQSQLNTLTSAKGAISGQTWTGAHDYTGATVTVATPSSNAHAANKLYVDSVAFSSALPAVSTSSQDKAITNNGAIARWDDLSLTAQSFFLAQL